MQRVAVWDLPLRLFHWALLVAVAVSVVAVELLDDTELHLQSGRVVLGLLIFRLVWGLVGSSTAQFHRFVRGPGAVFAYWRSGRVQRWGHNPLGALSVVAMLVSLVVQIITGLGSDDEIFTTGPLAQFLSEFQVGWANQIHEWNSKVLFVLIGLHLVAIVYYQWIRRSNLIGAMISGRTNVDEHDERLKDPPRFKPVWLWLFVALTSAWVAWAIFEL